MEEGYKDPHNGITFYSYGLKKCIEAGKEAVHWDESEPLMPARQAADAAASVWRFSVTKPAFIRFLLKLPHAVWY